MRVLLINPNNIHIIKSNVPNEIDKDIFLMPPLGLLYIASFLRSHSSHEIEVLDMHAENISLLQLKVKIKEKPVDIVGIYTTTFNLIDVFLIARALKEINSNIHITLGGPHVNVYPEETMINNDVDSIILGEGELTFLKLLKALEQKENLKNIKGLIYKDNGKIIKIMPPELIQDLDMLPFPDRKMLPYKRYYNILSCNTPFTTMISSRGCPYSCIFCNNLYLGKRIRLRSSINVVDEMRKCSDLGIKEIFFYDDIFTYDEKRVIDICNGIIKHGLKINWSIRTRVNMVNTKILSNLKKAGCKRIQFGIESSNAKIISILKKNISISQVKEAFELSRKQGIETVAYFMIGSPTEQIKDILDSINFAISLNPNYVQFSITLPLPGTELYRMGLDKNIFKSDFWKSFAINPNKEFNPQFYEENLTEKDLNHFIKYAYRKFYFRPAYLFKKISEINSLRELRKRIKVGINLFNFAFDFRKNH